MLELVVMNPDGTRDVHTLDKSSVMLGRASGNDICLEVDGVSRYHARISLEGDSIVVEDLGSTNGTFVNSDRIEKYVLKEEDQISIGSVVITGSVTSAPDSSEVGGTILGAPLSEDKTPPTEVVSPSPTVEPIALSPESVVSSDPEKDERISAADEFYWQSLSKFLQPVWGYILDAECSEILINGPEEIFIEAKGRLEKIDVVFSEDELNAAVLNIAQYVGRRVSEDEPYLDARLPDGSRVAVLMPPCSRKGTSVSIRKFAKERLTLQKLVGFGSLTDDMVTFLDAAVRLKKNIIISGGTSSGKTSLLNVMGTLIPPDERILTIEDSAELQLHQPHILPMETKAPDKKGRGEVTIRDLVRASLRMRPDRIVVGEIRGGEALDLLQAMNTGHSGSMATVHASSPHQALNRLETLSLFSGVEIPLRALREQVASAVDMVVQASRLPDHSRKVTYITEIGPLTADGNYQTSDIFKFVREGMGDDGKILGGHQLMGNRPSFMEEMELTGLSDALGLFDGMEA